MPKITLNIPEHLPSTQTYEVNIDFDAASRAWRIHTAADNPRELRRRQRQYWKEVKSTHRRRSRRLSAHQTPNMDIVLGYVKNSPSKTRKSRRRKSVVKRLIEEC